MASRDRTQSGLKIPTFEPVPPTNIINRLINKILAPLFYLLFTIIMVIVVVPVYTIIENLKGKAKGRSHRGGQRVAQDYSSEGSGTESHGGEGATAGQNRFGDYLKAYSGTYGKHRRT